VAFSVSLDLSDLSTNQNMARLLCCVGGHVNLADETTMLFLAHHMTPRWIWLPGVVLVYIQHN